MARAIYRCRRKTCSHVWTIDYPDRSETRGDYGRQVIRFFRPTDTGRIELGYDHVCPKCTEPHARGQRIQGSFSNHPCDERCTSARGHVCECKCGGKNHGAGWLQADGWNASTSPEPPPIPTSTAPRWPTAQPRLF